MMPFSAILVVIILLGIAVLHLLWAVGSHWPAKDEATLAKTVVGSKDIQKMPPRLASLLVAMVLIGAAHVVLAYAGLMQGFMLFQMYRIILVAMILVFSFRGLAAYTPHWRAMAIKRP